MTSHDTDKTRFRLRYWNCRGRVQSVRYMLIDIAASHPNVTFDEDVELLEKAAELWTQRKVDETVSGPFHNLPVLHCNETDTFGQTLAIGCRDRVLPSTPTGPFRCLF
jgi:hypothetical protein